jgi:hypothetical protein
MDSQKEKYLSYMLRLWLAFSEEGASWRASLEDPETGNRTGFAGLGDLFGYLKQQTLRDPLLGGDAATGAPDEDHEEGTSV